MSNIHHVNFDTKSDGGEPPMSTLELRVTHLEQSVTGLGGDIKEIRGDIKEIRNEMSGLKVDIAKLETTLYKTLTKHIIWMIGANFTMLAIALTLVKLFF